METSKRPAEYPTMDEAKTILEKVDRRKKIGKRDYALLKVLLNGGMRKSELTSLLIGSLYSDEAGKYLYFECLKKRKARGKDLVKQKTIKRKIPLDRNTVSALEAYLESEHGKDFGRKKGTAMFLTSGKFGPYQKRPISAKVVDKVMRKYVNLSEVQKRLTPHSCRHRVLTESLRSGCDIETVREIAGNATLGSISHYLHTTEELKRKAIESVSV